MEDWRITFVDTGINAVVGERLKAVEPYVAGESMFLATYGDGLTDAPLDDMISTLERSGKTALFVSCGRVSSTTSSGRATDGVVTSVEHLGHADVLDQRRVLRLPAEIFEAIGPGEDLVNEPFARLIETRRPARVPVPGVLGADGHDQGQAEARRAVRKRRGAVVPGHAGARGDDSTWSAADEHCGDRASARATAAEVVDSDLASILDRAAAEFAEMAGKRLLVTGGAGFLGYYLVQGALAWNEAVRAGARIAITVLDNFCAACRTGSLGDPTG